MAKKLSLAKKAFKFLQQNPEQKFTAREIADRIREIYPDEYRQKPVEQHRNEVSRLLKPLEESYPEIKTTEDSPRKCYFTGSTDSAEIDQAEISETSLSSKEKEHDLYPILSEFLKLEHGIHSRRIDEKQSKNSRGPRGNKHLYPDLVGIEDLSGDWDDAIKQCVKEYGDEKKKAKLYSFEVKRTIKGSTVREAFLQAVCNSSWANFGYLVASDIEGQHTPKELDMLASLHGIGFIQLNAGSPLESQIMIPAKERSEIDWDTANRLTQENKDFSEYIRLIYEFHRTGRIREADWD